MNENQIDYYLQNVSDRHWTIVYFKNPRLFHLSTNIYQWNVTANISTALNINVRMFNNFIKYYRLLVLGESPLANDILYQFSESFYVKYIRIYHFRVTFKLVLSNFQWESYTISLAKPELRKSKFHFNKI